METRDNRGNFIVATDHLMKRDPILEKVIAKHGDCVPHRRRASFEALVRIVIGQQLSSKAAGTIFQRVKVLHGPGSLQPGTMKKLSDTEFRAAGVSTRKLRTIRTLTEMSRSGELNPRRFIGLDDDAVMSFLTDINGIGLWSAHMYLMFYLRRLDVFPATDVGIQNAVKALYRMDTTSPHFLKIADRWRPYRTVACWYLWRHLDAP